MQFDPVSPRHGRAISYTYSHHTTLSPKTMATDERLEVVVVEVEGTVGGQDDCDVLLAEGADAQQHGGPLGGEEAEGHVLPGSAALSGHAGGLRAPVLHDREGLLEGVGDRGLAVKGHRHLWREKHGGGRWVVVTKRETLAGARLKNKRQ